MKRFFKLILFIIYSGSLNGQSNLCSGSSGTPVFHEDFGEDTGIGDALASGTTTYTYSTIFPNEGEYTICNNTYPGLTTLPNPGEQLLWHLRPNDWTYSLKNINGKMLLVNANEESKIIYQKRIYNLCSETNYQFSLWAAALYNPNSQLCSDQGSPVNLKLQVWNINQSELLFEIETGNIQNTPTLNFQNYGLLFTTQTGQTEVLIKIINNNTTSGCGNDIAIDEIELKSCGNLATIQSLEYTGNEVTICERELPADLTLQLNYSGSSAHARRWQSSVDGVNWNDMLGETEDTLVLTNISTVTYYRVKIASSIINLNSSSCFWVSNTFLLRALIISPPASWGDRVACGNSSIPPLVVFPVDGITIDWYDSPTNGNIVMSNSISYTPPGPGTYYAQASISGTPCLQSLRTAVTLTWEFGVDLLPPDPDSVMICGGETVELDAGLSNAIYEWSPNIGDTQIVIASEPNIYTVTVRNQSDCAATRTFVVTGYIAPEIASITNIGSTVIVNMETDDYFEYSIDNINWQVSNVFENVNSGIITVYVRDAIQCGYDIEQYLLLLPPSFFTPNYDGYNDTFSVIGIERLPIEIMIFDRFGKLITLLNSKNISWDGTFNGEPLPSNDYWYRISVDKVFTKIGHVTLKR